MISGIWRLARSWARVLMIMFVFVGQPLSLHASAKDNAMPDEGKLAIEMDPFNLSMFERGRLIGKAAITLTLVVEDQKNSEMIRERMPQIRSDFLGALTILSRQRFDVNKPINPDIVRAYLTPFLSHRIGEGKVGIFVKHALITPT